MFRLDPKMMADFIGKDLIAFGTGGLGRLLLPYLVKEPEIKLHGVTNSRVATEDEGIFLNTGLPIRSLDAWSRMMPEATILLCVIQKYEAEARLACEAAGFRDIIIIPLDVIEMYQNLSFGGEWPTGHPMFHYACMANELCDVHKASFAEFRGCHRGETVVVIATGPSLKYYTQLKGSPHIGVNSSFLHDDISLDYYFTWDYVPRTFEKLKDYNFIKFMGRNEWDSVDYKIPEFVFEENHARRFFTGRPSHYIYTDIEHYPLMGFHSIVFPAIHFAVFTRPKRLLLVGCDCNFDRMEYSLEGYNARLWLKGHKAFQEFASWNYPDIEIISVNPIGLKGMFHDMYTESYLEAHPELDRSKCDVLDAEVFEK